MFFGFEYGIMSEQQYTTFIENCFKEYQNIRSIADFEKLNSFIMHDNFKKVLYDETFDCHVYDWKSIHQIYRVIFAEVNTEVVIIFLIAPYNDRGSSKMVEWVTAEFSSKVGEFSGERGQLNPMVNPNVNLTLVPENPVGSTIIVLSKKVDGSLIYNITEMIKIHFEEPQ